jgi:cytochrome b
LNLNSRQPIEHEVVPEGTTSVVVWDPIVRLFHWSVVLGCVLNLFVLNPSGAAHRYVGYAVAAALTIRLVWGLFGTRYARFSDFTPSGRTLITYLRDLRHRRERRFLGHNPAGAIMMLALMALLAGVSATGWMLGLDARI